MTTRLSVRGSGSTAGEVEGSGQQGDARTFPCDQCGADLHFSIGQQRLQCPYCGHEKDLTFEEDAEVGPQDFKATLRKLEERAMRRQSAVADQEVTCETCGGTVLFIDNLTSLLCTYCGAPLHRENVHDALDRVPPDGVLPFMVEANRARTGVKGWVGSRWFAPNAFKRQGAAGRFDGVYMPYWTYDTSTFSRYRGERGEHYYVKERDRDGNERQVQKTRWFPASGRFSRFFDDVLVAASDRMPQKLLEALEPWPFERVLPFTPDVMAGYLAQTYTVDLEDGWDRARDKVDAACRHEARRRIGGDTQRIHWIRTAYNAIQFKHLLLPVWLMSYRYGEKTYRVAVNACTGEVIGERPYSWVKIACAILAAVGLAVVLYALFGQK